MKLFHNWDSGDTITYLASVGFLLLYVVFGMAIELLKVKRHKTEPKQFAFDTGVTLVGSIGLALIIYVLID